ncbi:MAG: HAMP domain-containing histidine kinase [Lewinellaceae bacterium]|nr:HAMP domain-containing histidine kinase [Lewinellaceae bacterium]
MLFFHKRYRFLWLIFSSLAMLALFQAFWLRKVWREQRESMQQEANYLFQQTVMSLQDSLVQRSMVSNDHLPAQLPIPPFPGAPELGFWHYRQDTKARITLKNKEKQSLPDSIQFDQVQILITTDDSLKATDEPMGVSRIISRISLPEELPRKFSFRISRDTISTDSLYNHYGRALASAGIAVAFNIGASEKPPAAGYPGIRTDPAFSGLLTHRYYTAEFRDYQGFLLRKMLPHIIFSLLLFGVTAAAFGVIYKSLRQQQRLSALKNDFIANMTHELKTPITTVGVALEALSDFEVLNKPEQTQEYLTISKLELARLTLLVDKVLRLSLFEEKQPHLNPEPLDLAILVHQVLKAMKLQVESAGADIRFETEAGRPFTLTGDRLHLTSVVFNLIDNALKYRGLNPPKIDVSLRNLPGNQIALTVQDNGIGIAPEYRGKIFEKFFRVPAGDTHTVKGHGLGLSYVAQVIGQHGGSIRVESEVGRGSIFIVELPGAGG